MKKLITLFVILCITVNTYAQAPQKMSYQAVIRNASNALVVNQSVGMRISILQGSVTGTSVYTETHNTTTNANGLVSVEIGGGTVVSGSFTNINWANGPYFVKTETDPSGGTNYTIVGTSQLLSVPYAMHAKTAESVSGGINETDPVFNSSVAKSINANDTARWNNKLTNYTEMDPSFNNSLARNITANDTTRWNDNQLQQLRVSTQGDTLFMSRANWVIIPGISAANNLPTYPVGSVFCAAGATAVVEVTNPTTGKTWMDRNLGATRAASSSTDSLAHGDLYQWGRRSDGHQCRTSSTTATLSSVDQPTHGNFILAPNSPFDWRSPQNNNLWQGVNGVNNPCPSGYRLPTNAELNAERASWSQNNRAGAFTSPLKLPVAGVRDNSNGSLNSAGTFGYYWSSTVSGTGSNVFYFLSSTAGTFSYDRAHGFSVRCLKD
jgi:uncharacterized protein (TIGR02145 family)